MKHTATIIVFEQDDYNSMYRAIFHDAIEQDDVFLVTEKGYPFPLLYRAWCKFKLIPRLPYFWPFRRILEHLYVNYYLLPQKVEELSGKYEHIRVLFHNASLRRTCYPKCIFSHMRKKHATFNLLYLDPIEKSGVSDYANYLRKDSVFDKVFTFDYHDAEKYGIEKCDTPYSKIVDEKNNAKFGMYCLSEGKKRVTLASKIFKAARENNAALLFDLVYSSDMKELYEGDPSVIFHDEFYPYENVIESVCDSSCILDLMNEGQSGFTLRPYEAVVYNKKLLTNNENIFRFQYYDPRYMKHFSDPSEIDWNWVKQDDKVDYGYKGEFSPKHLLEKLV